MSLVKSPSETDETVFPMNKPYILLYSVHALSECLRQEALNVCPTTKLLRDFWNANYQFSQLQVKPSSLTVFRLLRPP